jgi:DNA-binding MarR family transcriptional regulator
MPRADDGTGFLIADVARLLRRRFAANLRATAVKLTLAQARALVYVSRQEGLRQVELAAVLEIQPITLARIVDQLDEAGLVERRKDPGDRRAYQLYLRPAARPLLARIARASDEVRLRALRGLGARDSAALLAALRRIRGNLA